MTYCVERKPRLIEDHQGLSLEVHIVWDLDDHWNPFGKVILEDFLDDNLRDDPLVRFVCYTDSFETGMDVVSALSGIPVDDFAEEADGDFDDEQDDPDAWTPRNIYGDDDDEY